MKFGTVLSSNQKIEKKSTSVTYVISAAFIVALIAMFTGVILWQEIKQNRQNANLLMQNATTLLSEHIEGIFNEADTLLQAVSFHYKEQALIDSLDPKGFDEFLRLANSWTPEFSNLGFIDSKGIYRYGVDQAQPIDLSGREYFIRLRDRPAGHDKDEMIFSDPIFTTLSKRWALVLALRVDHSDGSFAGVMFLRWDIDRLTEMLKSIDLGRNATIELRTSEMVQVSRHPVLEDPKLGPGNRNVPGHLRDLLQLYPEGGSYQAISALDGIERHYTYAKVGEYPFVVFSGVEAGYSFKNWSVNTKLVLLLGALMVLLTILGARKIYRLSLRRIQEQLNSHAIRILSTSPVAMLMIDKHGLVTQANQAAKRLFDYPDDLLLGMAAEKLHPASSLLHYKLKLNDTNHSNDSITEAQYVRGDGSYFSALQSLAVLPDANGYFDQFVETVVDITDLKLAQEQLKKQAETDKLTGLFNRHAGEYFLTEATLIAQNTERPFSVIMCDIDHFKRVNDSFGHSEGDRVLTRIANVLKEAVRSGDRCIRWGGEEFLIVLPGCPLLVATSLAKGMCLLVSELENEKVGQVTMSFGVAQWNANESVNEFVARVDRALYEAKHSGRNRVVIAV